MVPTFYTHIHTSTTRNFPFILHAWCYLNLVALLTFCMSCICPCTLMFFLYPSNATNKFFLINFFRTHWSYLSLRFPLFLLFSRKLSDNAITMLLYNFTVSISWNRRSVVISSLRNIGRSVNIWFGWEQTSTLSLLKNISRWTLKIGLATRIGPKQGENYLPRRYLSS